VQRGAHAFGHGRLGLEVGQAAAELGGEEAPHRLVLGQERPGGVVCGEGNGVRAFAYTGPQELLKPGWVAGRAVTMTCTGRTRCRVAMRARATQNTSSEVASKAGGCWPDNHW